MNDSTSPSTAALLPSWLCHLAFWYGLLFAAPTFVAFNNTEDIIFATRTVALFGLLVAMLASVLSYWLSRRLPSPWPLRTDRLLLALAFVFAIQCNVIHDLFDYGAFNGQKVDFKAYGIWFWLEGLAWLGAIPLLIYLLSKLKAIPAWLAILPILSFTLLLAPIAFSEPPKPLREIAEDDVVDPTIYEFSSRGNLVHLLPDGLQSDVVHEVFLTHPDLAVRFEGFTLYTDHVGLYQGTAPSLFTIMTGEPFPLEKGQSYNWVTPTVRENSYQNALHDAGYLVDYIPISPYVCIESSRHCYTRAFNTMKARGLEAHHNQGNAYSLALLADLTVFRMTPMMLKERVYNEGYWLFSDSTFGGFSPFPDPVIREWTEKATVADGPPVYKWYHYIGGHMPAKWTANCELNRTLPHERQNYLDQTYCVLDSLGQLLDRLRALDVYDQTAFIVSGDHGHNIAAHDMDGAPANAALPAGLMASGRPAFLVREKGATGPLRFSQAPTHLADIAPTALAAVGVDPGKDSAMSLESIRAQDRARTYSPYSISEFWTGDPIPYVSYTLRGPVTQGKNWLLSDIVNYQQAPATYEAVNYSNAEGFMLGASLSRSRPNREFAWVKNTQIGFLLDIPDPAQARVLRVTLHLPDWMGQQTLRVRANDGTPADAVSISPADGVHWQELELPLRAEDIQPGRNFFSLEFAERFESPEREDWFAAALLKSIEISQ